MKLVSIIALFVVPFSVSATRISLESVYDQGTQSLATVSCSDGPNGMLTKGYNVFRDLPTFPRIGGSSAVAGWNSPSCGTCWNVTYQDRSVIVTVIDHVGDGYNLSEEAMDKLTDNQAVWSGAVDGTGVQVAKSLCGLK